MIKNKYVIKVINNMLCISFLLVSSICICTKVQATDELKFEECEYTSDYKKWLKLTDEQKKEIDEPPMCSTDDNFYTSEEKTKLKSVRKSNANNSKYNSADYGYVTSIKSQGSYGICWAFSSIANIETSLIKEGNYGINNQNIDLSEPHLALATSNKYNIFPFLRDYGKGGNPAIHAQAYFMNRIGPINETSMPFSVLDKIKNNSTNITKSDIISNQALYNVNDMVTSYSGDSSSCTEEKTNMIKQYITEKGSITATIYTDLGVKNKDENRYYFYSDQSNLEKEHSILLIGWDDTIPASKFKNKSGNIPSRDGGWIVKNSWGYKNYDYISYDDTHVCKYTRGFYNIEKGIEDNHYIADVVGPSSSVTNKDDTEITLANLYNKKSSGIEDLAKISFYSYQNGQKYDLLYSPDGNLSNLTKIDSGTVNKIGLTTVKLKNITINSNKFAVAIKLYPVENKNIIPIYYYNSSSTRYNMQVPNPVTYISKNGSLFTNFKNATYGNYIYPIRAYTNNIKVNPATIDRYESKISNLNVSLINYKSVNLSWSNVSDASGYQLCYKKSRSKRYICNYEASLKGVTLDEGTRYDFKVSPYKTINERNEISPYSKTVSIYTLKKMDTPIVKKKSKKKVKVSIAKIYGATGYEIATSKKKNKNYRIIKTINSNKSKVTIKAKKGKKSYYKVRAYKIENGKKIHAPWSNAKKYKLK